MEDRYFQPSQELRAYGYYYGQGHEDSLGSDRSLSENDCYSGPQDLSLRRVKTLKDKMSHRMIEKRRRDRMNTCLEELCRLLPPSYIKQGQGRIEKTEIIESAIRYIRQLQRDRSGNATHVLDNGQPHKPCCQKKYETGFNECSRYVTAMLSDAASEDAGCLLSFLKARGIANDDVGKSDSIISGLKKEPITEVIVEEDGGRSEAAVGSCHSPDGVLINEVKCTLPQGERAANDVCPSSPNDSNESATCRSPRESDGKCLSPSNGDVYKFKKDISQRFVEAQMEESLCSPCQERQRTITIPGFILDNSGRSYIPMAIDVPLSLSIPSPLPNIAHPVSIQVKFVEPVQLNVTK